MSFNRREFGLTALGCTALPFMPEYIESEEVKIARLLVDQLKKDIGDKDFQPWLFLFLAGREEDTHWVCGVLSDKPRIGIDGHFGAWLPATAFLSLPHDELVFDEIERLVKRAFGL